LDVVEADDERRLLLEQLPNAQAISSVLDGESPSPSNDRIAFAAAWSLGSTPNCFTTSTTAST
jgi:hypothetical protein